MNKELSKSALNRKAFIAGIFYIITQLVVRGITFFVTPFYTRIVSTSQYGDIGAYESWLLIIVPVMSLCLFRSIETAKFDFPDKFEEYISAVQTLSYISIFACFTVITLFFKNKFMEFCGMNQLMYIFTILYTFAYTSTLYFQRREKQLMRYKHSTIVTAISMIPATLLSLLLIYLGSINGYKDKLVDLRIIGFYTPQIIVGIFVAIIMWKSGKLLIKKEYWKYALAFSVPLIPEMISIQIMNHSDKIMINKMVDAHSAGLFFLATTVSFIIWIIEDSVWNAWLPWLYEKISRGETEEIESPWLKMVYIFGYISWLLVALAPEIVYILGGKKYAEAIYLIAPMVTGVLFRFFSYCYTAVQNYHKKTKFVAFGTIVAMIVNVILNYIFIKIFGGIAAAYTTLISYFILFILQGFMEKKITGTRIAPLSKMIPLSIGFFVINTVSMVMFQWKWYIRYGVIIITMIIMMKIMLPMVKQIIKQIKRK